MIWAPSPSAIFFAASFAVMVVAIAFGSLIAAASVAGIVVW